MQFRIKDSDVEMTIFTTRADTVFGVTFMVLAPESKYVDMITTPAQADAVKAYRDEIKHKTERERMIDKKVSGDKSPFRKRDSRICERLCAGRLRHRRHHGGACP